MFRRVIVFCSVLSMAMLSMPIRLCCVTADGSSHETFEFVPNVGQMRDAQGAAISSILFTAQTPQQGCYLGRSSMSYVQVRDNRAHRIDVEFVGANAHPQITPHDLTAGALNFYTDGKRYEGVRASRKVVYTNLYPNIDLVVYTAASGVKYDFVVHPGGNPQDIVLRYVGAERLRLTPTGSLTASTSLGKLEEQRPYSYQTFSNTTTQPRTRTIPTSFERKGNEVRFRVGRYDRTRDLVIDPYVVWATYYGGSGIDDGIVVRPDKDGNVFMVGGTVSTTQIATAGAHDVTLGLADAFIAKFNTDGVRQWATYFGGSSTDAAWGLALTDDGRVFVSGRTTSAGVSTTGAYQETLGGNADFFLSEFSTNGVLVWSTYYGGEDHEMLGDSPSLDVLTNGNLVLAGSTTSFTGIATANAYQDALDPTTESDGCIAVFTQDGAVVWATYLGGTGADEVEGLAVDRIHQRILVCGATTSTNGISSAGAHQNTLSGTRDGFIMSFDYDGQPQWGTYFGGPDDEYIFDIDCGPDGTLAITGQTSSATGVVTANGHDVAKDGLYNAYIAAFTWEGAQLWGTYYGDAAQVNYGTALEITDKHIYGIGVAVGTDGFATSNGLQPIRGGMYDGYIVKFNMAGERVWGSFFGGEGHELMKDIYVEPSHTMLITGITFSTTKISTAGAHQATRSGGRDAFLAKICDLPKPSILAGDSSLCSGTSTTITVSSESPSIRWYDGATTLTQLENATQFITPTDLTTGIHQIWVEVGTTACTMRSDTLLLEILPLPAVTAMNDTAICRGDSITLRATGSGGTPPYSYRWQPAAQLNDATIRQPRAFILAETEFTVEVTDARGCKNLDKVTISQLPVPRLAMSDTVLTCREDSLRIGDTSVVAPRYTFLWTPSTGISDVQAARPKVLPDVPTLYHVTFTDTYGCQGEDSVFVDFRLSPLPVILPVGPVVECQSDSVVLRASKGYSAYRWNTGATNDSVVVRASGSYSVTVQDANSCEGTSDTVVVVLSARGSLSIDGPDAACLNTNVLYRVVPDAMSTYTWRVNGGGVLTSIAPHHSASIAWSSAGTWMVVLSRTNADGCLALDTVVVVVADSLKPSIHPTGPVTLCRGTTVVLRASKGFSSYAWSNGAAADSIVVTTSGSYSVKVQAAGGCEGTSQAVVVTVVNDPPPSPRIVASDRVICAGETALLSLQPMGFVGYVWNTGATTPGIVAANSGLYWCSVVDANGCTGVSDTIEIRTVPQPDATITPGGALTFCEGGSVELAAPAGPFTYRWTNGATSQKIIVYESGTYGVKLSSGEGCNDSSAVVVQVYDRPDITIVGPDAVCFDSKTSYTIEPSTYIANWKLLSTGFGNLTMAQGSPSNEVAWGSQAGTVVLEAVATTEEGCTDTARLTIVVDAVLHPDVTASGPTTICTGDSVTLSVAAGFASYQWSDTAAIPGATTSSLVIHTLGTYTCSVTNALGCSGTSDAVVIVVNPVPDKPVISLVGGLMMSTPGLSYTWAMDGIVIPGAQSQSLSRTSWGYYTVTITNEHGCRTTSDPFLFGMDPRAVIAVGAVPAADPDAVVSVPIVLLGSDDLDEAKADSYVGTLRYNGTMLIPTGSRGGSITLPDRVVAGTEDRMIDFAGRRDTMDAGTLMWIDFVTLLGNDTCTSLELSNVAFTDAPVLVSLFQGEFCESGICIIDGDVRLINSSVRLALQPLYPNPANSSATIRYSLFENGPTQLIVVDLVGNTIGVVVDEIQQQGEHIATLDLRDVAVGWYQVVLKTTSTQRHQLLIVGSK